MIIISDAVVQATGTQFSIIPSSKSQQYVKVMSHEINVWQCPNQKLIANRIPALLLYSGQRNSFFPSEVINVFLDVAQWIRCWKQTFLQTGMSKISFKNLTYIVERNGKEKNAGRCQTAKNCKWTIPSFPNSRAVYLWPLPTSKKRKYSRSGEGERLKRLIQDSHIWAKKRNRCCHQ